MTHLIFSLVIIRAIKHAYFSRTFVATIAALALGIVAPASSADDGEIPFDEANIFFELNDTDGDLGIHSLIDGEPWKRLEIEDPNEREMLNVRVKGRLKRQGLTEFFFESAEPTFDELKPKKFFRRFPEGLYEVEGLTLDGEKLENEVEVTHLMPSPPLNNDLRVSGVLASSDCEAKVPTAGKPIVISWDDIEMSHPDLGRTNEPIEVEQYQVVVEDEESGATLSVELPPDVTSYQVSDDFIRLNTVFKYEVLVREASGNQTATESCFEVE
jgi:hypothetical protein